MPEIAEELGVSRSSVSSWTRDVAFDPTARRSRRTDRRPRGSDHPLRRRKEAEIAGCARTHREVMGLVRALAGTVGEGRTGRAHP
jgi:hypothetical protein